MKRWWMGLTLLALGVLPGLAWSQYSTIPSPVGTARIPEPTPDYVAPPLVPGPLRPEIAPAGPPDSMSLPQNHSSAFQTEDYPPAENVWFHLGAQMLTRTSYGQLPLFYVDGLTNLDSGRVPQRFDPQVPIVDVSRLTKSPLWGVRGSIGYMFNDRDAVELNAFTMFENDNSFGVQFQGRLNSYFEGIPLGFEGNNGMWRQADRVEITRNVQMHNVELNYRYTSAAVTAPEIILGVRYFDLRDRFSIYTGDDDLTFLRRLADFLPDNRRQATLEYQARNRILAPQLGFEWLPMNGSILKAGFMAKGAWGANFTQISNRLSRGDNFLGFSESTSKVTFSQVYEINSFFDLCILERMRLRAGYQVLWALGIADAQDQVNFNLAEPAGRRDYTGSQFYHGPMVEFQFLF